MHFVRKLNRAKWFQIDVFNDSDVTADTITNCLQTKGNALSVWQIHSENDLNDAVLAIISNQDHIESLDVVILNVETIENYNIQIVASDGITPVEFMINSHRNLSELTYLKLGFIKDHIIERIRDDKMKRFTKFELLKILKKAIADGILKMEDLKADVRKKVE